MSLGKENESLTNMGIGDGQFLWLRRTRQLWKFVLFLCGLLVYCGAVVYTVIFKGRILHNHLHFLFGLLLFAWFPWSVRCRACRTRVYWQMWRKKLPLVHNPWAALEHIEVCPFCGDDGRRKAMN